MPRRLAPALLFVLLAVGPLAAQPPAARQPFDSYRFTLDTNLRTYTDPVVQAALKLTDEQKAKLAKIPGDLMAKHKEAIDKELAADKEASEKQAAVQADMQKKIDALIEKHLTADQRKRLGQMIVQAMSLGAFNDAEIAKALSLTPDDQAKFRELQEAGSAKFLKDFPDYFPPTADAETRQKYVAAQRVMLKDTFARFVETLTADQQKAWKELAGEPSDAAVSPGAGGRGVGGIGFRFFPGLRFSQQAMLLTSEKALDELKVEKPARDALATGWKAIQDATRDTDGGRGGFTGRVSSTISREAMALARQVLTEPQAKRLEQIRFQISGTGVFSAVGLTMDTLTVGEGGTFVGGGNPSTRPGSRNLVTQLTLTPAQVAKIDAVLADASKRRQQLSNPGGFGGVFTTGPEPEEQKKARLDYQRKVAVIESAALADIQATFDAGQKVVWAERTGEIIDVSTVQSNTPFGGFGGFARGPGGRNASIVTSLTREATGHMARGEYAAALATYDEAIRLDPANKGFIQQKASLLSSCPSEWVRDGKQAVALMRKVIEETKVPSFGQYLVLAAALAEAGQFDEAVKTQEKAITGLPKEVSDDTGFNPNRQMRPMYEARLKLYQEKKPYRIEPRRPAKGD